MKRILLTFIILATFIQLGAQNPEIVDPDKQWTYMWYLFMPPYNSYYHSYHVKFDGDTLINQNTYYKIWESDEETPTSWTLNGFAREDTSGYVYFRSNGGSEGLAYRFDILPGDTFTMYNPFHDYEFTVEVIEMEMVNIEPGGGTGMRWKLQEFGAMWPYEEYWIEGIGSLAGITYSGAHMIPFTGGLLTSLCLWSNGYLVYSNPEWSSCFVTVSTPENSTDMPELIIQPNPLIDKSHLTLKGFHEDEYQMEIVDMFGKVIKHYSICQDEVISINRGSFSSGLYLLTLSDGKNIIARNKLIIQ